MKNRVTPKNALEEEPQTTTKNHSQLGKQQCPKGTTKKSLTRRKTEGASQTTGREQSLRQKKGNPRGIDPNGKPKGKAKVRA